MIKEKLNGFFKRTLFLICLTASFICFSASSFALLAVDFRCFEYDVPASGDTKFIIPQKLETILCPPSKVLHARIDLVLTSNVPFCIFLLVLKMVSFEHAEHFMINLSARPCLLLQSLKLLSF